MTDQERITDFLCSEKKMAANYDTFASECVQHSPAGRVPPPL